MEHRIEISILKAYYDLIENSKHYIFIENQYLISKSYTEEEKKDKKINEYSKGELVKNEISLYIRRRIEKPMKIIKIIKILFLSH